MSMTKAFREGGHNDSGSRVWDAESVGETEEASVVHLLLFIKRILEKLSQRLRVHLVICSAFTLLRVWSLLVTGDMEMNQLDSTPGGQSIAIGKQGPRCPQGAVRGVGPTSYLRSRAVLWLKHSFVKIII